MSNKYDKGEILKLVKNVFPNIEDCTIISEMEFLENKYKDTPFDPELIYIVPVSDKPIKAYFVGLPCPYNRHIEDCNDTEWQNNEKYLIKCLRPDCYVRKMELWDSE